MSNREIKNHKLSGVEEQPLLDYIPFDPEKELEMVVKITDPDLKKESLEAYKKELFEQKIGIAKLIDELIKTVVESPEIELEKLKELVYQKAPDLKLDPEQLSYFDIAINRYQQQHQLIQRYQEESVGGLEIYYKSRKKYPTGEINIKFRLITINLEFSDWNDYAKFVADKDRVSKKEIENLKNEWAALIGYKIEDLIDGVVAISPKCLDKPESEKESTILHEEMHAVTRILLDTRLNTEAMRLIKKEMEAATKANDKEGAQNKFKAYLYYELLDYLNSLADEVIAWYREGEKEEKIRNTILAVDDYLPKIEREIKDSQSYWSKELGKFKYLVNERQDYLGSKIAEKLNEMFEAIKILEEGKYSQQEIIALLMTEPPEKWLKWAQRLT